MIATIPYETMQHIPLLSAYLCQDCNSVGNCSRQCPACASGVLMCLASVLDRENQVERNLISCANVLDFGSAKPARVHVGELNGTFSRRRMPA